MSSEQSSAGDALTTREVILVKLYVDTTGKQVTVSKPTEPKNDQNGSQRSEKGTGRLMWSTQVIVLDETGGEVIAITTAGEKYPFTPVVGRDVGFGTGSPDSW